MDEILDQTEHYELKRRGRFLIAQCLVPHRVLSTSTFGGGQRDDIVYLVNHQSCEGSGHQERFTLITGLGDEGYHNHVCAELNLPPETVALMGTAANMTYAACVIETFAELRVMATVTAGVEGNAGCAGDPALWHEGENGWVKSHPHEGTINTMLFINWPLTQGALARSVITLTEAKTAALQTLAIVSRYSSNQATGTGTDQYCVAVPINTHQVSKTNTGHHAKLGELIGKAVRRATLEALRWQNGLEPSYTRSLNHALRRFGFKEDLFLAAMEKRLPTETLTLLGKNIKAILYEPQVAAAAYAFAAVLDRIHHGTLSSALASSVLRQQAATMATALSARPDEWVSYWEQLAFCDDSPMETVYDALSLGWQRKWT